MWVASGKGRREETSFSDSDFSPQHSEGLAVTTGPGLPATAKGHQAKIKQSLRNLHGCGGSRIWGGSQKPSRRPPSFSPPHEAGALQVGWPQTPASWVRVPQTIQGHGCRLADLSGLWPGRGTSGLPAGTWGSWEPAHLSTAPALCGPPPCPPGPRKSQKKCCSGLSRTPALCVSAWEHLVSG